jgi:hypothetical protein
MKVIITENQKEKMLRNLIKNNGVVFTSNMVGGIENLFDVLTIESPMDFLHLFDDLKRFRSEEYPNWLLFLNESKDNLIAYNLNKEVVYINSELVWSFLRSYFGMSYQEIQELTKEWLSESYNLTVVQTHSGSQDFMDSLI